MQIAVAMIKCHESNNTDILDILYVEGHEVTECNSKNIDIEYLIYLHQLYEVCYFSPMIVH